MKKIFQIQTAGKEKYLKNIPTRSLLPTSELIANLKTQLP